MNRQIILFLYFYSVLRLYIPGYVDYGPGFPALLSQTHLNRHFPQILLIAQHIVWRCVSSQLSINLFLFRFKINYKNICFGKTFEFQVQSKNAILVLKVQQIINFSGYEQGVSIIKPLKTISNQV